MSKTIKNESLTLGTSKIREIFELMVSNNIETFKHGDTEITRKSLEIMKEEKRAVREAQNFKMKMRGS